MASRKPTTSVKRETMCPRWYSCSGGWATTSKRCHSSLSVLETFRRYLKALTTTRVLAELKSRSFCVQAIDFAKEQNDHDLWEDLLKYSESRPTFIKGLLQNVGPEIDPIRLIRRIRNGLEVPGLKPALIKILQDFNIQVSSISHFLHRSKLIRLWKISLIEGCKTILNTDCRSLMFDLHAGQSSAYIGSLDRSLCAKCFKPAFLPGAAAAASATSAEALSIIFLCRHVYHISCALPDTDLPSRPQHFLNPLLLAASSTNDAPEPDRDREIAGKILFASQLKARAKTQVRCPACADGKLAVATALEAQA